MRYGPENNDGRKGAALVELAIVLPLLLVLIFGIIEFGLLLYNRQIITNASREAARFGIVQDIPRKTGAEITAVVDAYCANHLITFGSPAPPTTVVDNSAGTNFGDDLRVTVTYPYDFLVLPNFITTLSSIQTIRADTVMKYE